MTGRDLIVYILSNNLEDEPIFTPNGGIVGFLTADEAAVKFGVTRVTIGLWWAHNLIEGYDIEDVLLIPANAVPKKYKEDRDV